MTPNIPKDESSPFELKGSLFTLTVLHLRQTNLEHIDHHLAEKVKQAPGFFQNAPVVVDLENLVAKDAVIDFSGLFDCLRRHGLIPVALRHPNDEQRVAALLSGLPTLPESRAALAPKKSDPAEMKSSSKIHPYPVRSGQQVYAPDGDLILLGAISPGAEVLADGNIHVYGPLRGRALAGIKGDTKARIFCRSLEAELVSIAGQYRVIEEIDPDVRGKFVQIYLADNRLLIESLTR